MCDRLLGLSESDDPGAVFHTFQSFTNAFIYVLAGGNDNLRNWGLNQFMGADRPKKTSIVRGPALLSDLVASVRSLKKKGKARAVSMTTVTIPDADSVGEC